MTVYTRTFDVTARIAADLQAVSWSPHPVTARQPPVTIGTDTDQKTEAIVVRIRTDKDDATAEWQRMSKGGRDERFIVDVWIRSNVPGRDWQAMWDRLSTLANEAMAVFTHPTTGKFLPPGGSDESSSEWLGVWTGAANVELHNQFATDQGWSGECRIAVRIAAQI